MKSVKVLDCTLRDGGYYNKWDFSNELVSKYLHSVRAAGVDFVEIGFRSLASGGFLGPYAYSTDPWIESINVPDGLTVGVMCNAKELLQSEDCIDVVDRVFSACEDSPVDFVRIAAHFDEVDKCGSCVQYLHDLGYRLGFNLMQTGGRSRDEIVEKARLVSGWPVEVLYFADSFGNMAPDDVIATTIAIKKGWNGPVGFHAHDNMGYAMGNCAAAEKAGVTWFDATVLGMGRGAGNARLEYLLLDLQRRELLPNIDLNPLMSLVTNDFSVLHKKYEWGANLFYHLSAIYNVHPTYVQEMLSDDRYDHDQMLSVLKRLGDLDATGYRRDVLRAAIEGERIDCAGTWVASGWLEGRDVLVIGPGEKGHDHVAGLIQFIDNHDPVVLCLNSNGWFPSDKVHAWVSCSAERMLLDQDYYQQHRGKLVAPAEIIPISVRNALRNWELLDYGICVKEGVVQGDSSRALVSRPLTALYALALVTAGGASRIFLAGIDGFRESDPRHREMEEGLKQYQACHAPLELISLTPTTLTHLRQSSVYAPEF